MRGMQNFQISTKYFVLDIVGTKTILSDSEGLRVGITYGHKSNTSTAHRLQWITVVHIMIIVSKASATQFH